MYGARSTWLAMRFSTPDGRGENASNEPMMRQRSDVPGTRKIDVRHDPSYRSPERVARWSIPDVEEGKSACGKLFPPSHGSIRSPTPESPVIDVWRHTLVLARPVIDRRSEAPQRCATDDGLTHPRRCPIDVGSERHVRRRTTLFEPEPHTVCKSRARVHKVTESSGGHWP